MNTKIVTESTEGLDSSVYRRTQFHYTTKPGCEVYVSGSFCNWNVGTKKMMDHDNNGQYMVTVMIPPGIHEYKFIVDGQWFPDPECPKWVVNEFGSLNSIVEVH